MPIVFTCRLEMQLRVYSCLTKNDTIVVHYIDEDFYLDVVEIKPAVCCAQMLTAMRNAHPGVSLH